MDTLESNRKWCLNQQTELRQLMTATRHSFIHLNEALVVKRKR